MSRKKICLINNLYKPYAQGGAEHVIEIIANGFKCAGHEVFIITTCPIAKKQNSEISNRVYYIPSLHFLFRKLPKPFRLIWHIFDFINFRTYFKIKNILKKEKPDMVNTHNLSGIGFLIPLLIKKLGIKHIHTLHDIQLLHPSGLMIHEHEKTINGPAAKIYQMICKKLFKDVNVVISPSDWLMEEHVKRGMFSSPKRIILPNPIEISGQPREVKRHAKSEKFKLLYIGQVEEHKGILFLIEAFNKINKSENYELTIAGSGSLLSKCKHTAGNNNFKFLGRVKHDKINELMIEADLLLVPSLCYENSPTVIYEALACGLPIIASRIGGITEIVHKHGGILFTPGSRGDIAKKINWSIKNYKILSNKINFLMDSEYNVKSYIEKLFA